MSRVAMLFACIMVLLLASIAEGAGVPQRINYQAVLLDDGGNPVTDLVNVTFRIHDNATRGAILWEQYVTGIQPDDNGQFSVILGNEMNPITEDVLTGEQRWLGIQVEGDPDEMSPRTELVSSTYSFRVNTVDGAAAGIIYGPLTVEEAQAKAADARVIVTCSAKSPYSVKISPCDGTVLQAIDNADVLGEWGILAPGQTYIDMTDFSAKAEGASIRIRPPSVDLADVFTIQTSTGDPTFNLQSDPDAGAEISFYTPNVARASAEKTRIGNLGLSFFGESSSEELLMIEEETPGVVSITGTDYSAKAAGASVRIRPPTAASNEVLTVETSTGTPTFQLQTDPSGATSMTFDNPSAKATNRLLINNSGIYFINVATKEIEAQFTDQHVYAKGTLSMGENMSNDGNWSNAMGFGNSADGDSAVVCGGYNNSAAGHASAICGGSSNDATGPWSFVGGGWNNTASGDKAAVCAGGFNTASQLLSTIGGGWSNLASGEMTTIGGGIDNEASLYAATVAGGRENTASADYSTVGGGAHNRASGQDATVGGGSGCLATGPQSTVAGGTTDTASGLAATVGGGRYNAASGDNATVPGGRYNRAAGNGSFAAGRQAKALHDGCFVWGDNTAADFASTATNQFLIRASGGVGIGTNSIEGQLDISGNEDTDLIIFETSGSNRFSVQAHGSGTDYLSIHKKFGGDGTIAVFTEDARVGINMTAPAYTLDVNGDINVSGSYNVKKGGVNYTHPDYVFEPDYKLMSLDELRKYVAEKKALPGVITAEEVKKNEGFKMDELLVQMLEKLEEQTLYILQLEERIAELEKNR